MPVKLTTKANERSTYVATVTFTDEDGTVVTPNAGTTTWTLTDNAGNVINGRLAVAIASASSIKIVMTNLDLAVGNGLNGTERRLLVEWVYNSSIGSNLPGKEEFVFDIHDFVKPIGIT